MHNQKLFEKIIKKKLPIFSVYEKIEKKKKLISSGKKTRNNCKRKRAGLCNFRVRNRYLAVIMTV